MGRTRRHFGVDALEPRRLFAGITQLDGIGYLPSDDGANLQRYDIAAQRWLPPVRLLGASAGTLTASHVDADGIYVAHGQTVMRYAFDGSNPTHLINVNTPVNEIHSDGPVLFLNHTDGFAHRVVSIDKNTNGVIQALDTWVTLFGSSISTTTNRIFGRSKGSSPGDIYYAGYDDSGHFTRGGDSPYHGTYPSAENTWTFPDGAKVVDDSGNVYATADLKHLGSFGSTIDDVAFAADGATPIVLRGNTLTAYGPANILPTGSKSLARPATKVLAGATHVIAFNPDPAKANGYDVQVVPLSALTPPTPPAAVNPVNLRYEPDDVELMGDGKTLLILDVETRSVFTWDSDAQRYGPAIALVDLPRYMAYSAESNALYIAYPSGLINRIDLSAAAPLEHPFATLPDEPRGLSTAGKYVFAADESGSWATHYTFGPDGAQVSAADFNYLSDEYVWSAATGRMYFFRDAIPSDLFAEPIGADGTLDDASESPLHTSEGFSHPIRVSPDGSIVILGSGVVHDAVTLARQTGGLGGAVSDIAWLDGTVYTMRADGSQTGFQQWTGATFAPGASAAVRGTPVRLLSVAGSRLVAITQPTGGKPEFRVMDANFRALPASPGSPSPTPTPTPPDGGSLAESLTTTLPQSVVGGARLKGGRATVQLVNRLATPVSGAVGVTLFVSADDSLDAGDAQLASVGKNLKLAGGAGKSLTFKLASAPSVGDGEYRLLARVVRPGGETDVIAAQTTFRVEPPFVDLNVTATTVAAPVLTRTAKSTVKVTMTNAGNVRSGTGQIVTLYAMSAGDFDAGASDGAVLTTAPVKRGVDPQQANTLTLNFTIPLNFSPGHYQLVAVAGLPGSTAPPPLTGRVIRIT